MIRILSVWLGVTACALASSQAQAASSSYTVTGSRAKACSLAGSSGGLTVADHAHTITITFSPTSVAAWCNTAGTLSVSSTRLLKSGTTTTFVDYTVSVAGWGSAMSYTTAATPPAAKTQSNATLNTTLSFTCASGCTEPNIANNTTYTATITLALTPN